MIKINLVPAEILAKAQQRQRMIQAAVAATASAAMLVFVSLGHIYSLNRLQRHLAEKQARLKKLEVIVAQVEELEKTRDAVRARLNIVTDLLKGRTIYPTFMSDFSRSVPAGVRVKTLGTNGGGSVVAPVKLTISAEARNNEDIAAWIKNMEESGRFSGVELGPVTNNDASGDITFSLTSIYTAAL